MNIASVSVISVALLQTFTFTYYLWHEVAISSRPIAINCLTLLIVFCFHINYTLRNLTLSTIHWKLVRFFLLGKQKYLINKKINVSRNIFERHWVKNVTLSLWGIKKLLPYRFSCILIRQILISFSYQRRWDFKAH